MSLRAKLKKLVTSSMTLAECIVKGHLPFNSGSATLPRLFQSKEVGNGYRDIQVCDRCGLVYATKGELTAAELAEEAKAEAQLAAVRARLEKAIEEQLNNTLQQRVNVDKTALN